MLKTLQHGDVLLPWSKKVLSLNSNLVSFCMEFTLCMYLFFSGCSSFLQQSKNMSVKLIDP